MAQPKQIQERSDRVLKVIELLSSGHSPAQIVKITREQWNWKANVKSIYNYIKRANTVFAEQSKTRIVEEFGKALHRLNSLYNLSLKNQDFKACLAVQQEINKMLGFTNRAYVEHINSQNTNVQATIKVEYVHTGKKIAKSESEIDLKRITSGIQDAKIITDDEERPGSEEAKIAEAKEEIRFGQDDGDGDAGDDTDDGGRAGAPRIVI